MRLYGTSTGDGVIRISPVQNYRKEIMTEELFWRRVDNLLDIINAIQDDMVYRAMWERKLKELMQRKDVYE